MNFKNDVLDRSQRIPVVVDFWAPWCGPCRVLGPVIEQLASENKSKWELVKLNTEEHQDIAVEYNIRSIPNVKLFSKGRVIAEFAGALPRHQIIKWLEEHLPSEEKNAWATLIEQIEPLSTAEGNALLDTFLSRHPGHREALLMLARRLAFSDPGRATELVSEIKMGEPGFDIVEDINTLTELAGLESNNGSDMGKELFYASGALIQGALDEAVERIIEVVKKDKNLYNDLPRRTAIAIFRLLGNQHPTTKKYRRLFDMALY